MDFYKNHKYNHRYIDNVSDLVTFMERLKSKGWYADMKDIMIDLVDLEDKYLTCNNYVFNSVGEEIYFVFRDLKIIYEGLDERGLYYVNKKLIPFKQYEENYKRKSRNDCEWKQRVGSSECSCGKKTYKMGDKEFDKCFVCLRNSRGTDYRKKGGEHKCKICEINERMKYVSNNKLRVNYYCRECGNELGRCWRDKKLSTKSS